MKALTIVQKEKYKNNFGNNCPICESENIHEEGEMADGEKILIFLHCLDCSVSWTATYTFSNVELDDPEPEE
jgi:formate dehydrogenase maturation protein FdhE